MEAVIGSRWLWLLLRIIHLLKEDGPKFTVSVLLLSKTNVEDRGNGDHMYLIVGCATADTLIKERCKLR